MRHQSRNCFICSAHAFCWSAAYTGSPDRDANGIASRKGVKVKRYSEAERTRIRDVYTTTRLTGGVLGGAARELAAELGRTEGAILQQFTGLSYGSRQAENPTSKREFSAQELALIDEAYADVSAGRLGRAQAARVVGDALETSVWVIYQRFTALRNGSESK
jgi:hypothetical protein